MQGSCRVEGYIGFRKPPNPPPQILNTYSLLVGNGEGNGNDRVTFIWHARRSGWLKSHNSRLKIPALPFQMLNSFCLRPLTPSSRLPATEWVFWMAVRNPNVP